MNLSRRVFIRTSAAFAGAMVWNRGARADAEDLARFVRKGMEDSQTVGADLCAVKGRRIVWNAAFGYADIESDLPRTTETIQNIASISKTITATAVMQLVEQKRVDLDEDIDRYLPFSIRNPRHPDAPITIRHLLTHTSSTRDGSAYGNSYACGDPTIALRDWIESCLTPTGVNYDPSRNFIPRAPGSTHVYSNTGYGVLGVLVETVTGQTFAEYSRKHVLDPAGIQAAGWYLNDIDIETHATPYVYLEAGDTVSRGLGRRPIPKEGHAPLCLYSFPNLPDGLLRTNAHSYGRFLGECIAALQEDSSALLRRSTVTQMLHPYATPRNRDSLEAMQGLAWYGSHDPEGRILWGHSGGDPGVSTLTLFDPKDGVGAAIFANGPGGGYFRPALYRALDLARQG